MIGVIAANGQINPIAFNRYTPSGGNWWEVSGKTCIQALNAVGASSLANSYVDLSGSANNASVVAAQNAPAWDGTNGWTFNGTDQCLTTGIAVTGIKTTLLRAVVSSSTSTLTTNAAILFGAQSGSGERWWLAPNYRGTEYGGFRSINVFSTNGDGAFTANGVSCMVEESTSSATIYYDGTAGDTDGGATGNKASLNAYIGARNLAGSPDYTNVQYSVTIQAVANYSDTLTPAEIITVSTAMNALT